MIKKEIQWLIEDKYNGKITKKLKKDIVRLKNDEPLDYIIGWKNFLGCKIDLSFRPLIPRPETEYWAELAIKEIFSIKKEQSRKIKVLDIFTGSGCLGLAVLKNTSNTAVDFVDKEALFLRGIKKSLLLNKINSKRFKLIKSDVFSKVKVKYDFILANPPYVSLKEKVGKSVLTWEPKGAVFAKDNGMALIKKFLNNANLHLKDGGVLYMEFSPKQKISIQKLLTKNGFKKWEFLKDQFGRWRFLRLKK